MRRVLRVPGAGVTSPCALQLGLYPHPLAAAPAAANSESPRMAASTTETKPAGTSSSAAAALARGLEGIVAGESAICSVEQGKLIYRGYEIHDLAAHATFEQVAFVLLEGHK